MKVIKTQDLNHDKFYDKNIYHNKCNQYIKNRIKNKMSIKENLSFSILRK